MESQGTNLPFENSKIGRSYYELRWRLAGIIHKRPEDITPSKLLVALIPVQERRRAWKELRQAGLDLPELRLSNPVFFVIALMILLPVTVLAYLQRSWLVFLGLLELTWITRKLTRPWALYPPAGCETVLEAVLCTTSFHADDFRAGLWPREEIAAKVRSIFAQHLGVSYQSITDETRITDICC